MTGTQTIIDLNKKQEEFLLSTAKTRLFLGGRGSGKSFALGVSILDKAIRMPKSSGVLASTTYNQILTKTMKSVQKAWQTMGYVKNVHYVVGKVPPKHFKLPLNCPEKWHNVITFYWGSTVELLSLDRPDLARGGSYDFIEIDEAALLKMTDWTKILLPSIRDNLSVFGHCPFHQQASFYTSIPWKPSGYWILEFEEKQKLQPKKYKVVEADAYDNLHVLGAEGIERMRESMEYLEFQIEVMNKRIRKVKNAFYNKFDADKHSYRPQYIYDNKADEGIAVVARNDVNKDTFIDASFDFGGWINCATVWQQKKRVEQCISEHYEKGDDTLKELVYGICETYKDQRVKHVRVWGEPRGWDKRPDGPPLFHNVKKYFQDKGWRVHIAVPPGYKTEYQINRRQYMNDVFDEDRPDMPVVRFNEETCKNTIIVLQTVMAKDNGEKDKSKEKDRDYPQEHAPHLSDTVDYYIIHKYSQNLTTKMEEMETMDIR
jgi:hypothetical protein